MSSNVSSVANDPCSMQSTPARMQAADAGVAVGVRRHPQTVAVGLVDDGLKFFVGVLLAPGGGAERHHATRSRDLDQFGAVLDLVAHGLAHLGHTVGDALLNALGHDARGQALEHGRVEVAPGRGDGVSGREDAGPGEPAVVDRLDQVDVEQESGRVHHEAEVATRREAGLSVVPQFTAPRSVRYTGESLTPCMGSGRPSGPPGPPDEHVELHVHQPGQQGHVTEVHLGWPGSGARPG